MKQQRPVNLDLTTIKFPVTAIASILHRVSGVLIFLFLPVFLWMLQLSLKSEADFEMVARYFSNQWFKLAIFIGTAAVIYHLLAGMRHLLMDLNIGLSKCCSIWSARFCLLLAAVAIVALGVWQW